MRRVLMVACLAVWIVLLIACVPQAADEVDDLVVPTTISQTGSDSNDTSATPFPAIITTSTSESTGGAATGSDDTDGQILDESDLGGETFFEVAFVEEDDVLNVRSGPGVEYEIVGTLSPDATGVRITGPGQISLGSTWTPVELGDVNGWVNSRFLSETLVPESFCNEEAVLTLLDDLNTAFSNQDGNLLSLLVHPERGLHLRHSWWNPEIRLDGSEVEDIFISQAEYDWGVEDGSGFSIVGPFSQVIYPLIEQDFLPATESECNVILHGGTAGLVQLPPEYESINFYSFHRPGTDEFNGMDWGSWVIGIESWQGAYYLSYMIHFAWEI